MVPAWLRHRCFLLLVLLAGGVGVHAEASERVIHLDQLDASGKLVIGRYLARLEDATASQGVEWASAPGQRDAYVVSQSEQPNLGYSRSAHWLRFTVDTAGEAADLLLELAAPTLDQAQLFSPRPDGTYSIQTAGDQQPWASRSLLHRHLLFRVAVASGTPATFYLRVASSSLVMTPLTLWRPAQFEAVDARTTLVLGMFYGALVALFLYNLFLYFSLRDRAYLLYVSYLACFGLALSVFDGLAFQYLWPEHVIWANRALATMLLTTLALGSMFSQEFLGSNSFSPLAGKVQKTFAGASWLLALLAMTGTVLEPRHFSMAITVLSLGGVPIILWVALSAIARGYRPARYFLLAWSALLVCMLIAALRNLGLVPINIFSVYGLHFGLVLDGILLSTALADRIRALREEMIAAQRQLIDAARHYQEVLERRAAELAASNRELENFSYTVAHDLRSPLRAIDGFSHLIGEEVGEKLGPDAQRDLGYISENARKMSQLIDGLLDYSRIGRVTPNETTVDMRALAQAVAQEVNRDGVATIHAGMLPAVKADAMLLRQVWANLLENAVKFSAKHDAPAIWIECEANATELVFSVRDNGAGFDMQYADKLFGMFQRMHNPSEFEGTGVGLAIVKRVVERHGGRVWAMAGLGSGATFYFALPAERRAENP